MAFPIFHNPFPSLFFAIAVCVYRNIRKDFQTLASYDSTPSPHSLEFYGHPLLRTSSFRGGHVAHP